MILDGTSPDAIARAARHLAAGELVAFPTETVYGLGADAGSDAAVAGIFAAKGRPSDHPLIVHVTSEAMAQRFAREVPPVAHRLMQAFWPGPLTVILPRREGMAGAAAGASGRSRGFGTASAAALDRSDTVYCLTPLHHQSGLLVSLGGAVVGGARIAITIDIGFGDATVPGIEMLDYPTLLDLPRPRLRSYAPETAIAEKFQAMVMLGQANSRMKDFYDIWVLSQSRTFEAARLSAAIRATFERRGTPLPTETPLALTESFSNDPQKQQQWRAFCRDIDQQPGSLVEIVSNLKAFLMPHAATE